MNDSTLYGLLYTVVSLSAFYYVLLTFFENKREGYRAFYFLTVLLVPLGLLSEGNAGLVENASFVLIGILSALFIAIPEYITSTEDFKDAQKENLYRELLSKDLSLIIASYGQNFKSLDKDLMLLINQYRNGGYKHGIVIALATSNPFIMEDGVRKFDESKLENEITSNSRVFIELI